MKVEKIQISTNYRQRFLGHQKTGKITILTTDKAELSIEQQDKLFIFLEKL